MSKLKELIERLCPDGVEYKPLKEIAIIKNGKDYKHCSPGDFPVYGSGGIMTYVDQFCYDKPTVLLPRKGSIGKIYYVDTPFWNVDTVYYTDIDKKTICPKFLYYFLTTIDLEKFNCGKGAVPSLTQDILYRIKIPVPPLEVQEEIVKILDRFSDYTAELQAELQARKEQYEYYRNLLLTFNPSACGCGTDGEQEIKDVTTWGGHSYTFDWKPMGEICKIVSAPKKLNRKDYGSIGKYPIIDQGQEYIVGYSNREDALLPEDEYVLFGDHTRNIKYFKGRFIQGADGLKILKSTDVIIAKFLYHIMKTLIIIDRGYNRHWTIVAPLKIPVPPIELQKKIVSILDRFETLVNDLTQGLPAEIAAVKEQYEYYRNKLLTFKKTS